MAHSPLFGRFLVLKMQNFLRGALPRTPMWAYADADAQRVDPPLDPALWSGWQLSEASRGWPTRSTHGRCRTLRRQEAERMVRAVLATCVAHAREVTEEMDESVEGRQRQRYLKEELLLVRTRLLEACSRKPDMAQLRGEVYEELEAQYGPLLASSLLEVSVDILDRLVLEMFDLALIRFYFARNGLPDIATVLASARAAWASS